MHSDGLNTPENLAGSGQQASEDRLNVRRELTDAWEEDFLFLTEEEFDSAVIGVQERIGQPAVIAYDTAKIIEILSRSMTRDEAWEYFEFNILGAYVGEKTPVFVTPI
jgi:hypothetical protein